MTTVYIDTDDKNKIQEFLNFAMQKFHFKIEVAQESINQRKYKSLPNDLDHLIRSAKSTNTAKAQKLKTAMEGLHELLDSTKMNMSINEAKEEYFNSKVN
jgi:predicted enzyme involved in methoxymalonyl-ACP biosynthesis